MGIQDPVRRGIASVKYQLGRAKLKASIVASNAKYKVRRVLPRF